MRLTHKQKQAVISWLAEGLGTGEINDRATKFKPLFNVSREQVDFYRKTRNIDLLMLKRVHENDALNTGLALRENRIIELQKLAELMMQDIHNGFLWTDQVKAVGSGGAQEIVDYSEFNAAEIAQLRGVMDDIAKEMGERRQGVDVTSKSLHVLVINERTRTPQLERPTELHREGNSGGGDGGRSEA